MAQKLTPDSTRTDLHRVSPRDLVVRPDARGRFAPPDADSVKNLARSMWEQGQLQPINVRKDGDEIVITAGFTRHEAAMMILEGFSCEDGTEIRDPEFRLSCQLRNADQESAFLQNIAENAARNATTAMDDAHNHQILRDRYGYTNPQIQKVYGCSLKLIYDLEKLLNLGKKIQMMVHDGVLPVTSAVLLTTVPEAEREQIIASAKDEHGKIKGTAVKAALRTANPDKPKRSELARTKKEIVDFFKERAETSPGARPLSEKLVSFIEGTITPEELSEFLEDLFLAKV